MIVFWMRYTWSQRTTMPTIAAWWLLPVKTLSLQPCPAGSPSVHFVLRAARALWNCVCDIMEHHTAWRA